MPGSRVAHGWLRMILSLLAEGSRYRNCCGGDRVAEAAPRRETTWRCSATTIEGTLRSRKCSLLRVTDRHDAGWFRVFLPLFVVMPAPCFSPTPSCPGSPRAALPSRTQQHLQLNYVLAPLHVASPILPLGIILGGLRSIRRQRYGAGHVAARLVDVSHRHHCRSPRPAVDR
jgi:hypothetical protein